MATDWLDKIKPMAAINQACTHWALRHLADDIDAAVNGNLVDILPDVIDGEDMGEVAYAWMEACYLLADLADIPTDKIRELARGIWKGAQGDLFIT
jgi:hypothetical protein